MSLYIAVLGNDYLNSLLKGYTLKRQRCPLREVSNERSLPLVFTLRILSWRGVHSEKVANYFYP